MKKFAFGILLVFFFFAPKEAFSLAYDKKKGTTLIGTEKGTTEDEGFFFDWSWQSTCLQNIKC
jgi:hypothetical protein